jgi:hypothetical protein
MADQMEWTQHDGGWIARAGEPEYVVNPLSDHHGWHLSSKLGPFTGKVTETLESAKTFAEWAAIVRLSAAHRLHTES